MTTDDLHPLVRDAARGRLPEWAEAHRERRAHMERVAALLERWATEGGEAPLDVARWTAAGWLHDSLRDADPGSLRPLLDGDEAELPDPVLHGPAAAERLRREGVVDGALLRAVAYHTLGHPELDELGRALYCADFLEPGRSIRPEWRASLRERMPGELDAVTRAVLAARIGHLLDQVRPVHPLTVDFWNVGVGSGSWAGAREA